MIKSMWIQFKPRVIMSIVCVIALSACESEKQIQENMPLALQQSLDAMISNATSLQADSQAGLVYLDFWASWCKPCVQSFPWMNRLQKKHPRLTIVAVNMDFDVSKAKAFLNRYPAQFMVHYDAQGRWAEALSIKAIPSALLVKDGRILARYHGFNDQKSQRIEADVTRYLGG